MLTNVRTESYLDEFVAYADFDLLRGKTYNRSACKRIYVSIDTVQSLKTQRVIQVIEPNTTLITAEEQD